MNDDEFVAAIQIGLGYECHLYDPSYVAEGKQLEQEREQEILEALLHLKDASAKTNFAPEQTAMALETLAAALGLGSRWKAYARL